MNYLFISPDSSCFVTPYNQLFLETSDWCQGLGKGRLSLLWVIPSSTGAIQLKTCPRCIAVMLKIVGALVVNNKETLLMVQKSSNNLAVDWIRADYLWHVRLVSPSTLIKIKVPNKMISFHSKSLIPNANTLNNCEWT